METNFFLGANSRQGFYSLYDELFKYERLYIIKGGPGCGKSSFMRRVAGAAAAEGYDVERVLCSGDPTSLDAMIIPELSVAVADGTAPHVLEPRYPTVRQSYIDLGRFCDGAALAARRDEVIRLFDGYKPLYAEAYRLIAAAASATDGLYDKLFDERARDTVARRAKGIAARELTRSGGSGSESRRFIDAFTCEGRIRRYDTALALCPKLWLLDNDLGLAPLMLEELRRAALSAGRGVIVCPDPLRPELTGHLLIPSLGIGFLSDLAECPFTGSAHRHIRLDALADDAALKAARGELRAMQKASRALMSRARQKLAEARALHDELEAVYNPCVDFRSIYALAERFSSELLTKSG